MLFQWTVQAWKPKKYWPLLLLLSWAPFLWFCWNPLQFHCPVARVQTNQFLSLAANSRLVLFWTPWFSASSLEAWDEGRIQQVMKNCPYDCQFSVDKSLLELSDAVVYHGWPEGPKYQIVLVYYMMEPPPPFSEIYASLQDDHDFNWTMTYRRDSDIPSLYGDFEKIPGGEADTNPVDLDALSNRSLVAGMISSCNQGSSRDRYIAEMKNYIPVDMYGKCYDLKCERTENCYEKLSKKYKFWLSFENSVCRDYLTEKFFLPLRYGMVPVYLGHPDNLSHAPPGSYIHTKDFRNPRSLAKYLLYLDRHPEKYARFFEWRKKYRLKGQLVTESKADQVVVSLPPWCDLCTKLHTFSKREHKSYRNVASWFLSNNTTPSSICVAPPF